MQKLLFEALYRNNVLFVSLLMEYGASIEELTEEQLIIICVKTMVKQTRKLYIINHLSFDLYLFLRTTMLLILLGPPSIRPEPNMMQKKKNLRNMQQKDIMTIFGNI